MGSLREAPATVPALVAVGVFVVWATSQAGYPLTHWAPGALIVLALLIVAVGAVPLRGADIPSTVKLALGCLAAYTALSYLSILWAGAPGEAWEGANRTLLYLLVFALFALWPGRGRSAALVVGLWTFAMIVLAVYAALRLDAATGKGYAGLFSGERFSYPTGYPNANAAQWLMAFWPALLLARGRELHWALRGLLAGGAVVLADVALLSLSRGSLYATPVMVVLVFALVPDRLRTFATAVPVAVGIGASAPFVLRVGNRIEAGQVPYGATHTAIAVALVAAVLVAVVVACGAAFEARRALSERAERGVRRAIGAVALATLLVLLVGGLAVAGNGAGGNPINGCATAGKASKEATLRHLPLGVVCWAGWAATATTSSGSRSTNSRPIRSWVSAWTTSKCSTCAMVAATRRRATPTAWS